MVEGKYNVPHQTSLNVAPTEDIPRAYSLNHFLVESLQFNTLRAANNEGLSQFREPP